MSDGAAAAPVFADAGAYRSRRDFSGDDGRLATLLADASGMLAAAYLAFWGEPWEEGRHPAFDASAEAVCCEVVARSLSRPMGLDGVTQFSRTTGPFSGSATFGSEPTGSFYLTRAERQRLGLCGTRVGSMMARGCSGG